MTKKILVPLLVAPLILAGCGNNKKALKPFEKGDSLLTSELVRELVGEHEEVKLTISEEKFTAPEGWTGPAVNPSAMSAKFDIWTSGTGDELTYHVVSLLANKEVASVKDVDLYVDPVFGSFAGFGFGYCYAITTEGTGDDLVYKMKAVDAYGNVLVDWSGKDDSEMPEFSGFVYEEEYCCVKIDQLKDNHYNTSFKVYAEDFSSLEDVEYLPGSGEAITYIDTEFEKDGKNYRVDIDTDKYEFNIYQVSDKGDKLVKTLTLPDRNIWAYDFYGDPMMVYSEYSYIVITDRVVADDAEEWTYLAPLAASFEGEGDTEGEFFGDVYLPGAAAKHLQEVHVIDLYNMEQSATASPYYIDMLQSVGLEELDIDEEILPDPYIFVAEFCDVDDRGYADEYSYHRYFVDDNFGIHDELFTKERMLLNGYVYPFGEGYIDAYANIYDADFNLKKQVSSYFDLENVVGDYAIVSSEDFDEAEVLAVMDSDGKLVTGFDYAAIEPLDDTHFTVYDRYAEYNEMYEVWIGNSGTLDLATGTVVWDDFTKYSGADGFFQYWAKGEGENLKFDAKFNGIVYKEVEADEFGDPKFLAPETEVIYQVFDPLYQYMKVGVKELREGSTDIYDVHWFKVTGIDYFLALMA